MTRLTLRLPETLHEQLSALAHNEAVSLNQYIVYALTRQVTLAYTLATAQVQAVQPMPEGQIKEQKAAYSALLQNLGQSTFEEVEKALAGREKVKREKGLTSEVLKALKSRIARQRASE
jgi:hypothetical protein